MFNCRSENDRRNTQCIAGKGAGDSYLDIGPSLGIRGPRIIALAGNRKRLWGEQPRIETRTNRNHWRVNSRCLTIGGNYSRSP